MQFPIGHIYVICLELDFVSQISKFSLWCKTWNAAFLFHKVVCVCVCQSVFLDIVTVVIVCGM